MAGLDSGLLETAGGIAYGNAQAPQIEVIAGDIIKSIITLMGIIFLGLALYAGYLWMTARGKEEQTKKSKDILEEAVIGLIIVLAAYAITSFVVSRLTSATGTGGVGGGESCDPGQVVCKDGGCGIPEDPGCR